MTRWIVAGCLLLAGVPAVPAQNRIPADGTEILRGLLKYHEFEPIERPDQGPPQATLVVIVGKPELPRWVLDTVADSVLPNGGALLVITDDEFPLANFFQPFGAFRRDNRVTPFQVECNRPQNCFRGARTAPFGVPPDQVVDPRLPDLRGFQRIATDRPRAAKMANFNPTLGVELLTFPPGSRFAAGAGAPDASHALALMSDHRVPGTAIVFANRAMFANELMVATDADGGRTDNFAFTYTIAKMIADQLAGRGPRKCLFLEDGVARTDFDAVGFAAAPRPEFPRNVPPVLPPLPLLLDFALDKGNDLVAKMEEKDFPNAIQGKDPNNSFQSGWLYAVAVIASVVLLRYLLARGWTTRHTPEQTPRLRINPDHDGGMIPERRRALLEAGNLYEPLRDHLRYVFAQWGANPGDAGRFPGIATDRPGRPRQRLHADLYKLWEIAFRPERTTITPDDLEDLEDMIADLAQAHDAGVWRFAADGGAA